MIEEPYFMGFVGGVESVLGEKSYALALQVVADLAEEQVTYRKWTAERRVDGVIVVDLRVAASWISSPEPSPRHTSTPPHCSSSATAQARHRLASTSPRLEASDRVAWV
ncbi:hypothetical protein OG555_09885 [Kribbella sp. NBC_01484]|uniref:hypothetical protein n=1 Tax=Kribbella sp. NBC_01484 TaxID=2903579 RepID=UPI002E3442A1|nr:hypothetical protein [Kribbella sp. NBC_01484]